jgi:hypothetical protein
MNKSVSYIAASLILFFGHSLSFSQQPKSDEIVMCGTDVVPKAIQQANASFPIVYKLDIDSIGGVKAATKVMNKFVPDADIRKCLESWKLPTANSTVLVSYNWEHGKGWSSLSISLPGHPVRVIRFR